MRESVGDGEGRELREPITGSGSFPAFRKLQLQGYFLAPFSQPRVVQSGTLDRLLNRDGP